jgi:hypothetical protein
MNSTILQKQKILRTFLYEGIFKTIVERATRIELATSAWEADVLPLNYARSHSGAIVLPESISGAGNVT